MDGSGLGVIVEECPFDLEISLQENIVPEELVIPVRISPEELTNWQLEEKNLNEDMKGDYENVHVRFMIHQFKKGRKPNTAKQNKSNLNFLFPRRSYKRLLKELKNQGLAGREFREAYCKGLVHRLKRKVRLALNSQATPETKYSRINTARLFLESKGLGEYFEEEPFNIKIKRKRKIPVFMTDDEFEKLTDAIINSPVFDKTPNYKTIRDLAYFILMRDTGATPSELVKMKYGDFNQEERSVKLTNKDGKKRVTPIDETTYGCVMEYIRLYNMGDRTPLEKGVLFRNEFYKGISTRSMREKFGEYAEQAGLERNLESMSLRYAFAKQHIDEGANTKNLARILGIKRCRAGELISLL